MAKDDLRWYGPGLGRPAAPSPSSQPAREARRAALAPANAERRAIGERQLAESARRRPALAEIPAALGTGWLADIPAGLVGLASAPFVGAEKAADNVRAVQEALTYQPRGDQTLSLLADAQPAMDRVGSAMAAPAEWVYERTGSPAAAAAAYTAPDALAELVGAGAAMRGVRAGQRAAGRADDLLARARQLVNDNPNAAAATAGTGLLGASLLDDSEANDAFGAPAAAMFAGFRASPAAPMAAGRRAQELARELNLEMHTPGSAEWHAANQQIHAQTAAEFGPGGAVHYGLDMLPRWEIDDSRAQMREGVSGLTSLRDAMHHPSLGAAYGDQQRMRVGLWPKPADGAYSGAYYEPGNGMGGLLGRFEVEADPKDARRVLLHEVQHDIQRREGFEGGSAPAMWPGADPALAFRNYLGTWGEMEARATEARRDMTAAQRAARYPLLDYAAPKRGEREAKRVYRIPELGTGAYVVRSPHARAIPTTEWSLFGD